MDKQINSKLHIKGNRILIIGNWSYKNMGDELILLGTIRLLLSQGKKIIISAYDPVWIKKFLKQFDDLENIQYIHEFPKGIRSALSYFFSKKIKELKIYRNIDAVIIGGGEILTEENKNAYRYWNFGLLPLMDKLEKLNIYLMGGIQIPKKKINFYLFSRLLKYTTKVYARDEESIAELKKIGYKNASFFMDTSWFVQNWNNFSLSKNNKKKEVFINLNKNGEKFYLEILNECKKLLNNGYKLSYVAVGKGENTVYDDMQYKIKLEKDLNYIMEIIDWEENFLGFLNKLSSIELVLTSRLHLFLIASYLGIKTKVFPYQKKILKMKNLLEKLKIIQ